MAERSFYPAHLTGTAVVPPSKSEAHRALMLASLFSDRCTVTGLQSPLCDDISATISLCELLGRQFTLQRNRLQIERRNNKKTDTCSLQSSAASFRMGLPLLWTLNKPITIVIRSDLARRVIEGAKELASAVGAAFSSKPLPDGRICITTEGNLKPGLYAVNGAVSSQFASGMLIALSAWKSQSVNAGISIKGDLMSEPYLALTCQWLERFGFSVLHIDQTYLISAYNPTTVTELSIPGDWSQAAVLLAAGALGHPIAVQGLESSVCTGQGDKEIAFLIQKMGCHVLQTENGMIVRNPSHAQLTPLHCNLQNYPDLFPPIAILCARARGVSTIKGASRLVLKECDRLTALLDLLKQLGVQAFYSAESDMITISGVQSFRGGFYFDCKNDHRMVMSAAIAALSADRAITVSDDSCLSKSWPGFLDLYREIGGIAE